MRAQAVPKLQFPNQTPRLKDRSRTLINPHSGDQHVGVTMAEILRMRKTNGFQVRIRRHILGYIGSLVDPRTLNIL